MPIKDKEKNREYQREWARKRALSRTKKEYASFRKKRNEWKRSDKGKAYDATYRAREYVKQRKSVNKCKGEYGEFYEAKKLWDALNHIIWTDERFHVIQAIYNEKFRTDRRRPEKAPLGDASGPEGE